LKDEKLDTLPKKYQERYSILTEPIESININIVEQPKILQIPTSLTIEEIVKFTNFQKENQINFARSYADMPGLDPDLIMHYLSINPGIK
jgi:hypothetical protein